MKKLKLIEKKHTNTRYMQKMYEEKMSVNNEKLYGL